MYHTNLRWVGTQKFNNIALGILAYGNYVVGLGYEAFFMRYCTVVYEHILRVALESHIVNGKHKWLFTSFYRA